MFKKSLSTAAAALLAVLTCTALHAQMAQSPLVKQSESVSPNIMYVFDDSGSMAAYAIYQYGGSAGGYGMTGPGGDVTASWPLTTFHGRSPDVNLMYYDPRVTYSRRIDANGTYFSPGVTPAASFNVYFYNPANTTVYSVKDVTITSGGSNYPSSGVTASFNDAPVGGVNATATVTTAATLNVTSIDVTNPGRGYPSGGATVTIGAPPAGGIKATGKIVAANLVNSGNVTSVAVNSGGRDYPAAGVVTATFSAPQVASGVNAAGTVNILSRLKVTGVTVTNHGSGYPSTGETVSFTAAPAGGTTATGTVNTATYYGVASTAQVSSGTGYTSAPTVTFSAPPLGGTTATGTAAYTATRRVSTVAINNGGSNYTSAPIVTFSAPPSGVTATGTASFNASTKKVTAVTVISTGSGYISAPTITFSGGGGSGAAATASTVVNGGYVSGVSVGSAGSGYLTAPTISFSGGGGSGAVYSASLNAGTIGISSITITDSGSGYTTAPTATLSTSGGGSGAILTVGGANTTATNVIGSITMTENGSGYTSTPTITLNNTSPGYGAAFTSTLGTTRTVGSITLTNPGVGYSSVPTCTITASSGSGATCSVTMGTTYVISGVTVTSAGAGYASTPVLKLAGFGSGSGATFTVNTNTSLLPGVNSQWNGSGTPTTAASYFTPNYTPDTGSPLDTLADATLFYPNTADAGTSKYPKFAKRTDCSAADSCSWAEEFANYTNWYNFHRTRLDLAKTGVGLAFQPLTNTFRLGWTALSTAGASSGNMTAGVRPFDSTTEIAFFNWLNGLGSPGSTPSRKAMTNVGNYFSRKDDGGPWADDPPVCTNCSSDPATGTANDKHVSCRRSYSIFMTDGYYNDTFTGNADIDSYAITNSAGYAFTAQGPYSDTKSGTAFTNTLADVAMKYWLTDLRTDVTNDLKPSDDPATWQHLNFSAIGLGLVGTLDSTDPDTLKSLTDAPGAPRTRDWPTPAANSQTAIDDMWHATINGRGALLNARNANELKSSIQQIVAAIAAQEDSQSGVAVSTVSLSTDTMKYTPWYTQGTWIGNVRAWHLDKSTASEICGTNPTTFNTCPPAWEVETLTAVNAITKKKTYTSLIDSSTRNVYVGNGNASGTRAVAFDTSLSTALRNVMTGAVAVDDEVINYLRGDAKYEDNDINKGTGNAKYRERVARMGDIVNSTPIFVYQNAGVDYSKLPSNNGFSSYWTSPVRDPAGTLITPAGGLKGQRTEGMLFVGANDGMFHAFRNGKYVYDSSGNLTGTTQKGGLESFAYIPRAILPTLNDLPSKTYAHHYYVDGPVVEVDAYINGGWKNVVLASTGGGAGVAPNSGVNSPGTGVFAIDVTNLNTTADSTAVGASNVLWEVGSGIASTATDFEELGYMISDVRSGPMLDGSWVAIFGNGYESKSCKAQLFVVNLATGALIKRLNTGAGDCSTAKNGLGGLTLVRNDQQQIIGAYAGDLLGNMWKFNFNDTSASNWAVDFGGDSLYTASVASKPQPITAPPTVIDLADPNVWADGKNTAPKPGYMVVFGTGKFFETSDIANVDQQSLYGVWDDKLFGAGGVATLFPRVDKTSMIQQSTSVTPTVVSASGTEYYDSTKNTVDYTGKKGWYLDYNNSGERLTYPIDTLAYHYVAVGTIAPQGSINTCSGGSSGNGYLYVLDALWGGMPEENVLGVPGVNGMKSKLDGRNVSLLVEDPSQFVYKVLTPEKDPLTTISINKPPVPVVSKKVRKWRQLFMR
jgi:type IV pilus assembly protein PilY1